MVRQMTKAIRQIRIEGKIAFVPLTKGYTAIIDADDAWLVCGWNWCANVFKNTVYAARGEVTTGKKKTIALHRVITSAPDALHVDHRNGDGLDNRKSNLRLVTRSQNMSNRRVNQNNTSGFKGVSWNKRKSKWQSQIQQNRSRKRLGYFHTPEEAHAAYCEASARLHGEFGRTA